MTAGSIHYVALHISKCHTACIEHPCAMALTSQQRLSRRAFTGRKSACSAVRAPVRHLHGSIAVQLQQQQARRALQARAATEDKLTEATLSTSSSAPVEAEVEDNWVPICRPEDLPKGVRKEFDINGRQVLVFWYRNQIYAIEARSPAEGAYSEGFIRAKFTQDYCIECPSTGSLFSLKDGSIAAWYPNNPVLRALTPAELCRPMEIYPVKLAQEAIFVDVSTMRSRITPRTDRGGAGTSLENNNVFTVQPNVYFEGQDPVLESASVYADASGTQQPINPATVTVGIVALGIVAVAGSATAIYYESVIGLAGFWVVLGGLVGLYGFNYVNSRAKLEDK